MARETAVLLLQARRHLGVSQGDFGVMLGASRRTGQRWERGGSLPMPSQLHELAKLIHPHSTELASRIAVAGGTTLEALGVVERTPPAPVAPPPPPPPPAPDPVHIVDTVVCAAAEAMQVMPEAIRPALRAAFRRARLAGLSVESLDKALNGATAAEGAATSKKGAQGARGGP
jgi:DNA-binding XRE family transcriptional regulator